MADNKLLWQVELLPPNQKNIKQVSEVIDGATHSQKRQTAAKQQAVKVQRQEIDQAKKFKLALDESRVAMSEIEEAARFRNASSKEAIQDLERERVELMHLKESIEDSNISREKQLKLLNQTQARVKQSHLATDRLSTGFRSMSSHVGSANSALVESGRVLSDLPFGFVAISNNIEVASIQFGRLKERTGSASAALKLMGKQLMGSTGMITLFASVVPAAIAFSMVGLRSWGLESKKASEKTDLLEGSTRDLIDAYTDLHTVSGEDVAGLQEREGELQAIESMSSDVSRALELLTTTSEDFDEQLAGDGTAEERLFARAQAVGEVNAQLRVLTKELPLTREELEELVKSTDNLGEAQKEAIERLDIAPLKQFRAQGVIPLNRQVERLELGLEKTADGSDDVIDSLVKHERALLSMRKGYMKAAEEGDETAVPWLKAIREQLELIDDALDRPDLTEGLVGDDPQAFSISDEFIDDMDVLDDRMQQYVDEQQDRRKESTKFLSDTIKDEFKVRMDMLDDGTQAEIQSIKMVEEIERQARRHGLEDHRAVESLKNAITERATQTRMEMELEREKELSEAKMTLVSEVANFTSAMQSAIGEDSKLLAIIELGIQKALKIGQVSTEANRRVFELNAMAAKATSEAGVYAASGDIARASALTASAAAAKAQAAKVKGMAAKTIAVIAATGLMEGIGAIAESSGGGGSTASGRGSSRRSGRGLGFQTDDEEDAPRRRSSFLPESLQGREETSTRIFVVQNKIDEEGIATLVRHGDRSRLNRARQFKSITKES